MLAVVKVVGIVARCSSAIGVVVYAARVAAARRAAGDGGLSRCACWIDGRRPPRRRRCAWTTTTPATRTKSASASTASSSSRCRGRAIPARPIDDTNRGKYLFEVVDAASGRVLYSRGFSSIYGEWETTGEAKEMNRTFSESLRFPAPDKPVRIVVKKRDARNVFRDAWTFNARSRRTSSSREGCRAPDAGALHRSCTRAAIPRRSSIC